MQISLDTVVLLARDRGVRLGALLIVALVFAVFGSPLMWLFVGPCIWAASSYLGFYIKAGWLVLAVAIMASLAQDYQGAALANTFTSTIFWLLWKVRKI